eukprot:COSAG02_NODE_400_length_23094_cov_309.555990_17_plen_320_part_00
MPPPAPPPPDGRLQGYALQPADVGVVCTYFCILFGIAFGPELWKLLCSMRRTSSGASDFSGEAQSTTRSATDYFLAGHDMGRWAVAASLFSSNIGSEHFVGLAGDGARTGLAVGGYELSAGVMLLLLGWVFSPIYMYAGVYTVPEFLLLRYNSERLHLSISCVSLGLYAFTKIAATLYAGALIMRYMLGWNVYASAITLVLATGMYTAIGGLRTVVLTECFQTCCLVFGGLMTAGYALGRVGGLTELQRYVCDESVWQPTCECCNVTEFPLSSQHLRMLRPADDPDFPWPGMTVGMFCGSLWWVQLLILVLVASFGPWS